MTAADNDIGLIALALHQRAYLEPGVSSSYSIDRSPSQRFRRYWVPQWRFGTVSLPLSVADP